MRRSFERAGRIAFTGATTNMRIKRIHHVTIAVRDLEGARLTFEQLFGVQGDVAVDVPAFGIREVGVPMGGDLLQLVSPVAADNPVMRFLERRGEGFYNLALEIEDLDDTVRELASQGVRVSDPIEIEPGVRSAFVTMMATHGLSVRLIEVAQSLAPAVAEAAGEPVDEAPAETIGEAPTDDDIAPSPEPLDLTPDEWSDVD